MLNQTYGLNFKNIPMTTVKIVTTAASKPRQPCITVITATFDRLKLQIKQGYKPGSDHQSIPKSLSLGGMCSRRY